MPLSSITDYRRRFLASTVDAAFATLSHLGRRSPLYRPHRLGLRVDRDLRYGPLPAHTLERWSPRTVEGAPVAIYLHGGGFRAMSAATHWVMSQQLARMGLLVYNVNYRLAPQHRAPAALEDAALALPWIAEDARRCGADTDRMVFTGESAGGNLSLALGLCCLQRRPEPFAARLFDAGIVPRAMIPACGVLQVSDVERFRGHPWAPWPFLEAIRAVSSAYLPPGHPIPALADPLLLIEQSPRLDRPPPPIFLPVGGADMLVEDSRRAATAWSRLGGEATCTVYPYQPHAFQALVFLPAARRCWSDQRAFLARSLGLPPASSPPATAAP